MAEDVRKQMEKVFPYLGLLLADEFGQQVLDLATPPRLSQRGNKPGITSGEDQLTVAAKKVSRVLPCQSEFFSLSPVGCSFVWQAEGQTDT